MTLVEIIVTIAIMGIITSICMPKNRIREYKIHSQTRILLNDIRTVKHRSMTEGGSHAIYLNKNYYIVTHKTRRVKKVELVENVRLKDNLDRKVSFNYNGTPIKAGTILIEDTTNKKEHEITIIPSTGRILLKEQ